jgi:antirestriction protein
VNRQLQTLQQEKEAAQTAAAVLREQLTSSEQAQETLRAEIAHHQTFVQQLNQEKGEWRSLHGLLGRFSEGLRE